MRGGITCAAAALVLGWAAGAGAVTEGQVDDFQDGTFQGWGGNSGLINQPTGGPAGAGDRFLDIDSGLGGLLGTFNTAQWSGDYVAAGVESVSVDVNNAGPDEVSLRLTVLTKGCAFGGKTCTAWTSTNAAILAAESGWQAAEFFLSEDEMTQTFGTLSLVDTLANAERILLRHDDGPPSPPGSLVIVDAVLGIDNVTALPEPVVAAGLVAGVVLLVSLERRRRSSRG